MTTTQLNSWFDSLDSSDLAIIFPGEFFEYTMSADPEDINDFIDEAEALWEQMSSEEKLEIYNEFNN